MSYDTLNEAKAALAAHTSTGDALKADLVNPIKQVSVHSQRVSTSATTALPSCC